MVITAKTTTTPSTDRIPQSVKNTHRATSAFINLMNSPVPSTQRAGFRGKTPPVYFAQTFRPTFWTQNARYSPFMNGFFRYNFPLGVGSHYSPKPAGKSIFDKVKPYMNHIRLASRQFNLPPELIAGFIVQESGGKPFARSHCGAMGLMQLMPQTARGLGVTNPYDPLQNIFGGAKYIRQMLNKFGRLDFAVAAYNAGPGAVIKHGGIPPFKETRGYVPNVLSFTQQFTHQRTFANLATNFIRA